MRKTIQSYQASKNQAPVRIINSEDIVGLEHLSQKMLLFLRALGSFLPGLAESEITAIHQVLEIGCGPGTWSMELAQTYYRQMRVTGVDTNPIALSYATAQARKRHLDNVGYLYVRDLAGPYTFPDDSFDLISAQFILSNNLSKHSWLRAMRECWRLLRPGGWLRLTDFEVAMSNAPANEELALLFIRAMHRLGHGVSPSDRHLGILCEMEPLLIEAGFSDVRSMSHMINYSSGAPSMRNGRRISIFSQRQWSQCLLKQK